MISGGAGGRKYLPKANAEMATIEIIAIGFNSRLPLNR
jgi:hypothetical protein